VRRRFGITKLLDSVRPCQTCQLDQCFDPLVPRQAHLQRPAGEKDPPNIALANQGSQLGTRAVYKEKGEDPYLDRGKLSPRETLCSVLTRTAKLSARRPIFDHMFGQTKHEHNRPVDASLEEDRPGQGPLIEAADEW
jgi:hypothetical protein